MTTIDAVRGTSGVEATASLPETSSAGTDDSSLLPEPTQVSLSADAMTALAQLMTRADSQDRTAAREQEDAADGAAMKAEGQRVAQMMDKADQDSAQALATGIGDIAGGALTATSGFLPDGSSSSGKCEEGTQGDGGSTNWRR